MLALWGEEETEKLSGHTDVPAVRRALPLPQFVLLYLEDDFKSPLACPQHPGRSKPFTGMGLLPVNTPSTSFPSIPVAWLMRACQPAQGLSHPHRQASSLPSPTTAPKVAFQLFYCLPGLFPETAGAREPDRPAGSRRWWL